MATVRCLRWSRLLQIIHEERHFIVVNKPAGLLSQEDETRDRSLADLVKSLLFERQSDPSYNPFVAPVHRLDRPVSGLSVLARTSKAASRLSRQFREGTVEKSYLAITHGRPVRESKVELWLQKDRRKNRVLVRDVPFGKAVPAVTNVEILQSVGPHGLVRLSPDTGRPHQLRATLAFLGAPICGDLRYGAPEGFGRWIALHAHQLKFTHPITNELCSFTAPPPECWADLPGDFSPVDWSGLLDH